MVLPSRAGVRACALSLSHTLLHVRCHNIHTQTDRHIDTRSDETWTACMIIKQNDLPNVGTGFKQYVNFLSCSLALSASPSFSRFPLSPRSSAPEFHLISTRHDSPAQSPQVSCPPHHQLRQWRQQQQQQQQQEWRYNRRGRGRRSRRQRRRGRLGS